MKDHEIKELQEELGFVERERDRYRAALKEIMDRDWVENTLDPQWAPQHAREALKS